MGDEPVYDEPEEPAPDALKKLSRMAMAMAELTLRQMELQQELDQVKSELGAYANKLVPDLMHEIGVNKIQTKGGFEIALKEEYRVKFPEDPAQQDVVVRWLNDTGNGGSLHKKIVIEFASTLASADQLAELIQATLPPGQADFKYDQTVHPATLGKLARLAAVAGKDLPEKELSLFHQKLATIKKADK